MYKFTVPTPFTPSFIDNVADLNDEYREKGARIHELYGSFQHGTFNSARPCKYLPAVSRKQFRNHVTAAEKKGIKFNYLFNAPHYGNMEYSHNGRKELQEQLLFLTDCGISSVTVTVPYLVEIINQSFPHLEIVTSTIGYVATQAGINQFTEAGADRIVLDVDVNRDFVFLESACACSTVPLEIIVNPVCINQCHFKYNHYSVASMGSRNINGQAGKTYNQYYLNWCFLKKLENDAEFLKSPWLRPEDLNLWGTVGVNYFKIAGRGLPAEEILRLCRAYMGRKFSGNLLDLLGWPHWHVFRDNSDGSRLSEMEVILDNEDLGGFLDFFAHTKPQCRLGCHGCGHCSNWAGKNLHYNDPSLKKRYISNMKKNLRHLVEKIPSAKDEEEAKQTWRQQAAGQIIER